MAKDIFDIKIGLEKLELKEGDILILTANISPGHFDHLMESFREIPYFKDEKIAVICLRDDMDLSKISEAEMNEMGWYRKK